ncbi:sensor histidine kinase [Bacillus arachidis]|uniref:sensor histidine kinase n=1 Tax=Bacillus arachidis TaxID=2819290 RepID=UPI00255C4833|nr:HAMP domain-containing sensor histidine kinase [Bacillus arachidis]WIY59528.1 HAMP domain-containing sensor histidine kinase [Bacillus arachidis]
MNRLGRKFAVTISVCIICIFAFSMLITNYFLPRYYVHRVKQDLNAISKEITSMGYNDFINSVADLEKKHNLTIVYEPISNDEASFNWSLRAQLAKKGLTLNKFWVTKETLQDVKNGTLVNKLYDQGKLKSSFLTSYTVKDGVFIMVGESIVHFNETAYIINTFNLYVLIFAIFVLVVLVWIWSRKITSPLQELTDISKNIAMLDFKKTDIRTNDEIEDLANSINVMSDTLKAAHEDLNRRNKNLKLFMSDITHELKTPLSLIKAYSLGIQDGLDDGTYVHTILKQTDNISTLIDELLEFSRIEREELHKETFDLLALFQHCLAKHEIEIQLKEIHLSIQQEDKPLWIIADRGKIEKVLNNLLSNAIKYTQNKRIDIRFEEKEDRILFIVENGTNMKGIEVRDIWEPFYVTESSRSKDRSGTGLGLTIVQSILNRHQFDYGVSLYEDIIQFYIRFPKSVSSDTKSS